MKTTHALAIAALLCSAAATTQAQTTPAASDSGATATGSGDAASMPMKTKPKNRAIVTGGPGYMSEAGQATPSSRSAQQQKKQQPLTKHRAVVTGGV